MFHRQTIGQDTPVRLARKAALTPRTTNDSAASELRRNLDAINLRRRARRIWVPMFDVEVMR
jgi:hypothetical protein